ncbi:MAG: hypothetical protein ACYDBB_01665 [Armatimonadota bacterium]
MMRAILLLCVLMTALAAFAENVLVIDGAEMAGVSGFRKDWDRSIVVKEDGATRMVDRGQCGRGLVADWTTDKPGAPVFDAVHRSLLVRFPGAAEKIAAEIAKGNIVQKVEIILPFVDTEFFPLGYSDPAGMSFLGDLWVKNPPTWHAVAWVLRKPWTADAKLGPTYNASVNGVSYWGRFGAQDEKGDRYPAQFGPAEVSYKVTEGHMDVSKMLADPTFGATLAERLRVLSDQGFLLRKWETYDARFNHGGYEYGGAPGHRGIRIKAPKLVITLAPGTATLGTLPPASDISKAAKSGQPTAALPSAEQINAFIEHYKFKKPAEMPEWQWARAQELFALSRGSGGFPETPDAYGKWLDGLLSTPYRMFVGHHTPLYAHTYLLYSAAMPAPVQEHMKKYWEAWLMPGRSYTELQHNQWGIWTKPANSYYAKTGDWRGNHSFYRDSYTRFMSTMNFNNNATQAALLGGAIINDPYAMEDGRYGLDHLLLRLWSWYDGTTQESIDHYYLGLTLYSQKAFADLGPSELDRMMGRNMLLKTMDELASCYHPATRRFIATSGRTGIAEVLGVNEGCNHILNTVSRKGTLHDVKNPDRLGIPVAGQDLPPDLVARQELIGPWMPLWMGNIVDDKPLPFEMTADFKQWGAFREKPLWKRSYLGRHYGLASYDVAIGNQTVPVMAQWRRDGTQAADNLQETGTLLMRFGLNSTEFYDTLYHGTKQSNANGSVGQQGGPTCALQWKNKAIVFTTPNKELKDYNRAMPEKITSLQSSIALANYQRNPTWKIYIGSKLWDGKLPARAKQSDRITIQDGVTYVGLIPIPATNLGRSEEILITDGGPPVALQGGGKASPTLVINSYNYYNQEKPFDPKTADWKAVDRAYGGFIIEVSDATEYRSFADFQRYIRGARLQMKWDDAGGVLQVAYKSGKDTLEAGFRPEFDGGFYQNTSSDQCFTYRRVNGQWPYLAPGIDRESNLSVQGTAGTLQKNGAVLQHQPGIMAYLLTEPVSGNYLFSNPLPDPQYVEMTAPGIHISADGRLGLAQVTVNPKENSVDVHYAVKEGQAGDDMATALFATGLKPAAKVTVNDKPVTALQSVTINGASAVVIPLTPGAAKDAEALTARYTRNAAAKDAALKTLVTAQAWMRYKAGQEHYLLTEPRNGAFEFMRLWPGQSPIEAVIPGVQVATDGNIALQRIIVSAKERRVEVDYAPYLQADGDGNPIKDRAKALLVFGMDRAPSVRLHGKEFAGTPANVTINGQKAYVIPLFGDDPASLLPGLEKRYADAMGTLPAAKP